MTSSEAIFPKPGSPIQEIFRSCGSCPRCISDGTGRVDRGRGSHPNYGRAHMEEKFRERSIKVNSPENLFPDEYILICSSGKPPPIHCRMTSLNPPVFYISNYGRSFIITDNGRGCEGRIDNSGTREELSPLTQEFINYYNSSWFWGGEHDSVFRREESESTIREYQKKSKKPEYRIEKEKEEIQKSICDMQKKETELVNKQNYLKRFEDHLLLQENTLRENEQKLNDEKDLHNQKSMRLFERENKISIRGSVETILNELLEVSMSIASLLDVCSSDHLSKWIEQIIKRINHIKTGGLSPIQVDEDVIMATIVSEPSAPPPGTWIPKITDAILREKIQALAVPSVEPGLFELSFIGIRKRLQKELKQDVSPYKDKIKQILKETIQGYTEKEILQIHRQSERLRAEASSSSAHT